MIKITCDKCDKPFEVDASKAGQKVECPACGDTNLVPSRSDRAAAAGFPPDSGPEQRVLVVRRAMFRAHPMLVAFLFLLAFGGLIGGIILFFSLVMIPWALVAWTLSIIAFIWLGVWKLLTFDETLEITNKRSILHRGILRKSTTEVLHDNIRNVQVDQSFWNRVWNVGSMGISSSAQAGLEIEAKHIPKPHHVRKVIDLYRTID
jgi:DNA-directed RNA polymerase subunit RPC12/RpoP